MGVFAELLEQLDRDVAFVHGKVLPVRWFRDPDRPKEHAWTAELCVVAVGAPIARATGPSGEDPLRRLAEMYAERAKERREGKPLELVDGVEVNAADADKARDAISSAGDAAALARTPTL